MKLLSLGLILCCLSASAQSHNNVPFPPHKIADDLYYVGTADLASYLVRTGEGLILINPSFEDSVPLIRKSVETLGFRFADVKILLVSHAHDDHAGGAALVKRLTGAKYMVMQQDVAEITRGGEGDFQYPNMRWAPAGVDRVLRDGDTVKLGQAVLTAQLTPGHTKGCTTWTIPVSSQGRKLQAVIVGSPNVNTGYKLVNNKGYPEIVRGYERCFAKLRSLPCDIFLGAHGAYYNLAAKYPLSRSKGEAAFIDPQGYRDYVTEREAAFRAELARQQPR